MKEKHILIDPTISMKLHGEDWNITQVKVSKLSPNFYGLGNEEEVIYTADAVLTSAKKNNISTLVHLTRDEAKRLLSTTKNPPGNNGEWVQLISEPDAQVFLGRK